MSTFDFRNSQVPAASCVYVITNTLNGKSYIGKTVDLKVRMKGHRSQVPKGSQVLYRAIRKYGEDAFTLEVLFESPDDKALLREEVEAVALFGTLVPNGYNMTIGGEGMSGHVVSAETRAKRRAWAKDNPEKWAKFKDYVKGPRSAEHRASQAKSLAGVNTWSKGRTGAQSAASQEVVVFEPGSTCGRYFVSGVEAAAHYKVDKTSISNWVRGKNQSKLGLAVAWA